MDKFAQRKRAQGMIDANAAADAAKMEKLQYQVNEYELLLQEMRKVNLKTAENAGQMSKAIQAGIEKIEAFRTDNAAQAEQEKALSEIKGQLEALLAEMKKQNEAFTLENKQQNETLSGEIKTRQETLSGEIKTRQETLSGEIKTQREVLSKEIKTQKEALSGEIKAQREALSGEIKAQRDALSGEIKTQQKALSGETKAQQEILSKEIKTQKEALLGEIKTQQEVLSGEVKSQLEAFLPELKKQMEEAFRRSEDFLHKESVKVYRNVQAATMEELGRQTEALTALQKESGKRQKAVLPLTIIVLLLLLADIAVHLFNFTLF